MPSQITYQPLLKDNLVIIPSYPGTVIPQGNWNANTNTPDITGATDAGYAWIVSVAGNTDLGGITDWQINDWAVKTSTGWAKIDNSDANGTVTSVSVTTANGVSGTVENPTTTPAISLTLGAITPTTVNGNTITTGTGTLTLGTDTLSSTGTTANTFTIDSDSALGKIIIDVDAGASDNSLTITNTALTGNHIATFQNASGTVAYITDIPDVTGLTGTTSNTYAIDSDSTTGKIVIDVTNGSTDKTMTITNAELTTDNVTITFPATTGTLALTSELGNYLLATGTTIGASSQAQTFTNGVNLSNLTATRIPFATTNGKLTDSANLNFTSGDNPIITVTGGSGSYDAPSVKLVSNSASGNSISLECPGRNSLVGFVVNHIYGSTNHYRWYTGTGDAITSIGSNITNTYGAGGTLLVNGVANRVGIGLTDAQSSTITAKLHISAGTATASTAPLKFTAGTNLSTPEAGVMEFDGINLYFTV